MEIDRRASGYCQQSNKLTLATSAAAAIASPCRRDDAAGSRSHDRSTHGRPHRAAAERGIGQATAGIRRGRVAIAVLDLDGGAAERVATDIGRSIRSCRVRRSDRCRRRVLGRSRPRRDRAARRRRGAAAVGALANIAGITSPVPFLETTLDLWNKVMAVNATGTYLVTGAFLPGMIERGFGRIVNMSSVSAQRGGGVVRQGALFRRRRPRSSASPRRSHANWPTGVTVNAVTPGAVDTNIRRRVDPEQEARSPRTSPSAAYRDPRGGRGGVRRSSPATRPATCRARPSTSTAGATCTDPARPRRPRTKEFRRDHRCDQPDPRGAHQPRARRRLPDPPQRADHGEVQGRGYVGQALGAADMLAAVYAGALRFRPEDPSGPGVTACRCPPGTTPSASTPRSPRPGSFRSRSSTPTAGTTPAADVRHGQLHAGDGDLRRITRPRTDGGRRDGARPRLKGSDARVINFLSDGELNEGSTWEAAMAEHPIASEA